MLTPAVSTFVSSELDNPVGLAFDAAGNLYVTNDDYETISKVTPAGAVSTFVSSGLDGPEGLAFDAAGNLYVANVGSNTISKVWLVVAPLTVTAADWTSPDLTLTLGSDGNLHVYKTGTTAPDLVSPCPLACLTNIKVTSPSSTGENLTIDSTAGDPIPSGDLDYSGGGGLIITGSGTVALSGTNSYTGGTTVSEGTLLINAASALPTGTSLAVGAGGTFIFDPTATAAFSGTSTTTAMPTTKDVTSSSPPSAAPAAADAVKRGTSGHNWQSSIVPPAALHPPQSDSTAALGIPAANGLVWSSITKGCGRSAPGWRRLQTVRIIRTSSVRKRWRSWLWTPCLPNTTNKK